MTSPERTAEDRRPKARLHRARRIVGILLVAAVTAGTTIAVARPSENFSGRPANQELRTDSVATDVVDHTDGFGGEGESWDLAEGGGGGGDESGDDDLGGGAPVPGNEPGGEVPDTDEAEPSTEPTEGDRDQPLLPAALSVPANMTLKAGFYTGSFTVANDGGASLDWNAWPDPGVTVSLASGTLAGGEEVVISFSIDASNLKSGTFERRIMIDAPDVGAKDLWVKGNKPVNTLIACKPGKC